MNKRILAFLLTVVLATTMIIPVSAVEGDNSGQDIFTDADAAIVSPIPGTYSYKLGAYQEFEVTTECGEEQGKIVQRKIAVEGPNASAIEYYDGTKWKSVKEYNTTIKLANDRKRKFRVKFNSKGSYIVTFTLKDEYGQLVAGSRRYFVVADNKLEVKRPPAPTPTLTYKKVSANSNAYRITWSTLWDAVSYNVYINGKKIKNIPADPDAKTISCEVEASYFAGKVNNLIGIVAINEEGLESVLNVVLGPGEVKKPEETSTTAKTGKSEITKPAKVKSFKAKNLKGKKVRLTWKKVKGATGYQIVYATNKKFTKNKKKITIKSVSTVKKTINKLKKKKTYYFKIRAYKKVKKVTVYSNSWSSIKSVKIKK